MRYLNLSHLQSPPPSPFSTPSESDVGSDPSDNSEPTLPSGKKGRLVNWYPSVNEAEMLDEDVYQKHLKTLNNELEKSKPRKDVLIDLMELHIAIDEPTFWNRLSPCKK